MEHIEKVENQLLFIRVKELFEPSDEVMKEYENLYNKSTDFETAYHFVSFLVKEGETDRAREIIAAMEDSLNLIKGFKSAVNKGWIGLAKKELKKDSSKIEDRKKIYK
jgi:hypothetical protein